MNTSAPPTAALPIADCPVCKLKELRSSCTVAHSVVSCNWCMYQCGPATTEDGNEEAVRLHNLLCAPAVQATADCIVQANVQCNACHRSLVGVTTGNAGCDTQCKPHGFACGLYGLKGRPSPAADEGAAEEICKYLKISHNIFALTEIKAILRKHSAVSPKAGRPQWMKEADCLLDRVAYELSQASMSAKLSDYMRAQMKRWSQALKEFRLVHLQPSSPPAVSGDEQEKERG